MVNNFIEDIKIIALATFREKRHMWVGVFLVFLTILMELLLFDMLMYYSKLNKL
jgi:hypothetical protein